MEGEEEALEGMEGGVIERKEMEEEEEKKVKVEEQVEDEEENTLATNETALKIEAEKTKH